MRVRAVEYYTAVNKDVVQARVGSGCARDQATDQALEPQCHVVCLLRGTQSVHKKQDKRRAMGSGAHGLSGRGGGPRAGAGGAETGAALSPGPGPSLCSSCPARSAACPGGDRPASASPRAGLRGAPPSWPDAVSLSESGASDLDGRPGDRGASWRRSRRSPRLSVRPSVNPSPTHLPVCLSVCLCTPHPPAAPRRPWMPSLGSPGWARVTQGAPIVPGPGRALRRSRQEDPESEPCPSAWETPCQEATLGCSDGARSQPKQAEGEGN